MGDLEGVVNTEVAGLVEECGVADTKELLGVTGLEVELADCFGKFIILPGVHSAIQFIANN